MLDDPNVKMQYKFGYISQGYARMASGISQESCQDWGFMGLGGVFSVEWIHKESLPFQHTQHILNSWNDNKKVQISRDGQVTGQCKHRQQLSLLHITDVVLIYY